MIHKKYDEISTFINKLIKVLKSSGKIMVPTNKTKRYIAEEGIQWSVIVTKLMFYTYPKTSSKGLYK